MTFQLKPNDIMVGDKRRTRHAASGHPADRIRVVQRSTVKGTAPMGRVPDTCLQELRA